MRHDADFYPLHPDTSLTIDFVQRSQDIKISSNVNAISTANVNQKHQSPMYSKVKNHNWLDLSPMDLSLMDGGGLKLKAFCIKIKVHEGIEMH